MANVIMMDTDIGNELDLITGKTSTQRWKDAKVHVFTNNHTPDRGDALATYSANEASFAGYAAQTLVGATWPSASVASHAASAQYGATLTWTRSTTGSSQTCYGIYVTDNGGTVLLGAALFDSGPYTITNAGDAISEVLTLTLKSEFT